MFEKAVARVLGTALLLTSVLFSTSALGEEGVSLEETVEWIHASVQEFGGWTVHPANVAIQPIVGRWDQKEKCKIGFVDGVLWKTESGQGLYRPVIRSAKIPLGGLDPISVRIAQDPSGTNISFVRMDTSHAKLSIEVTQRIYKQVRTGLKQEDCVNKKFDQVCFTFIDGFSESVMTSSSNYTASTWELGFMDKDRATRTAAALKHAIKLCGGKVDPF
jgi:hypothetical protein